MSHPAIPLYQVDAFTRERFRGNPAAVCPLERWLPAETMQAIAGENNVSETAFFVAEGSEHRLRWFTPKHEVELCGHATLASAFVYFTHLKPEASSVRFQTRSGPLDVRKEGTALRMDFPRVAFEKCPEPPAGLRRALPKRALEVWWTPAKYFVVYGSEQSVREAEPDIGALAKFHPRGVAITAPGETCDFVSRYFAPSYGIPEDPVTGSIHCALAPFWGERLGRKKLFARQLSARGGEMICELRDDRVDLIGHAVEVLRGEILAEAG